ncbi:MAG: GFA family protein [Mesorhizobium sp.]|uniref:GFA family protein n=1 Tax=Mesorhizobium sp. TaxID=1871066 RepID=UPI001AC3AAC1|nr:GFA family protein [Mesorhizobium sp.]MBN9219313.1 GFA family protein [Mesorhizobium sp.]
MSDDNIRHGGCLCGAVRFSVKGVPLRAGICHCQDCRRASGSAFNFFGIWERADFKAAGNLREFRGRSFCPDCGSRIASLQDDEVEIMLGSLDFAPTDIIPAYELWICRREPWLMDLQWAQQFQYDRTPVTAVSIEGPDIAN